MSESLGGPLYDYFVDHVGSRSHDCNTPPSRLHHLINANLMGNVRARARVGDPIDDWQDLLNADMTDANLSLVVNPHYEEVDRAYEGFLSRVRVFFNNWKGSGPRIGLDYDLLRNRSALHELKALVEREFPNKENIACAIDFGHII